MVKFKDYLKNKLIFESLQEDEFTNICIDDTCLNNAKCAAYNLNQRISTKTADKDPYNPKKFPTKAVDIIFPVGEFLVEIFFNTHLKKWDSIIQKDNKTSKLLEHHFNQFFNSNFFKSLIVVLKNKWPLKDKFYYDLYSGIVNENIEIPNKVLNDADDDDKSKDLPNKTPSGRKIVTFSDIGVNTKKSSAYCWPPEGKEFAWSSWKHWETQKPFVKLIFSFNDRLYGVTTSLYNNDLDSRGFRSYDVEWEPKLAWLTMAEASEIPKLSIFKKFCNQCAKKIKHYLDIPTSEIFKKINRPDKITEEEIDKTKAVIKNVLNTCIKRGQFDNFKWRNH